ncbi:MAG: DNA recombination protein RmuC, partial [Methylococcaceae bacterium]|nr:DNA recombination protein RmuC [Methylococcaceae bacterium]
MDFINSLPPFVLVFIGLLAGALSMRLLYAKDKTTIAKLSTDLAVSEEKLKQFQNRESEFKQLQQLYVETKTKNAELQTRINEQAKNAEEKLALLKDAEARLNNQFENLAGKIFDERNRQFTEHNKTSLDHIVKPLREQLGEFKQRIETVYDNENKDRISLREEIISLRRDTAQMNQEALNLTRALKGDKKAQGNWGEMILETVLEKSGLRKGIEYETQGA